MSPNVSSFVTIGNDAYGTSVGVLLFSVITYATTCTLLIITTITYRQLV